MRKLKALRKPYKKARKKHADVYAKERNIMIRYVVLGGLAGAGLFMLVGLPFVYHFDHSVEQSISFLLVFGSLVGVISGLNAALDKTKKIKSAALTFFHKLI